MTRPSQAWRQAFDAVGGFIGNMRESPSGQLFGVMWAAAPRLAFTWWALVVVRSALPAVFLVVTGLFASAIEQGSGLAGPMIVMGVTLLLLQATAPLHTELGTTLGYATSGLLHERLMKSAIGPSGIAHLEDPGITDEFTLARDFDLGLTAPPLFVCVSSLSNGFVSFGAGVASGIVLFAYAWWAPLVLAAVWISPHVLMRDSTVWRNWRSEEVREHQRHAEYAYRMAVNPPGAKELRLFGLRPWVMDRFVSRRRKLLELSLEAVKLQQRPVIWSLVLITGGNVAVLLTLAMRAESGEIGLGRLITYAGTALGMSALATLDYDWWLHTAAAPVPVVASLEARMSDVGQLPGGKAPAAGRPRSQIRFQGVGFSYPGQDVPVLSGVDLTIPVGSSIAIVGQNGAGKTTLAKLLCRLYDPQSGSITIDGIDLRSFDPDEWRKQVAVVFQDFVRYEWSLRDNVAPRGGGHESVIRQSLAEAGAQGLADLDTVLSRAFHEGTDLSGGQWQRVALARALYAVHMGARVVVLDEPTAQLDVRGEFEVFSQVLDATRDITTVLISHRFSTVRLADVICVVEGGRMVEIGPHEELMRLGGRYRTMFELQASRFTEEPDGTAIP